jgi:hypothetical protein
MTASAPKKSILKHPATIAAIVAAVSVGTLVVGDHTDLMRKKVDAAPQGQTLAEAMKQGATVTPTPPDSPITPVEPGPKRADPPVVTTPPPATH